MKRFTILLLLFIGVAGYGGNAYGQTTDTISVTVSLQSVISVSLTPNAWNIGAISLSSVNGPQAFTADVGNVTTKLEISATDGAGGWMLAPAAGADQFAVTVTSPALTLTTTYQTLDAGVAAYGSKNFDLTFAAPTSDTIGAGVDQSFSVTVKASAP